MDFVCQDTGTRLYGTISFDTIYTAFVPVFVLMAGQTWTDLMYRAMDAEHRWSSLYFVIVMVIMNFWILNLFTAVINEVFSEVREKPLNDSAFTTKKIKNKDSEKSEKKEKSYEIYGHTDKDGGRMLERMEYFWVIVVIVDLIYLCLPQYDTPTDQLKLYDKGLYLLPIILQLTIFETVVLLNMLIMIIMENFELKSEKKMHEDQICHFVRDYHFAGDHHYEQEELDKLENHLKKYLPFTELSSQDKECMENVESKYRYHLISSYEHSLLSESTLSTCTSDNHPTMSTYKTSEKPSSLSSFRNWCLVMVKPHRAKSKEVPINLNYNRVFDTIITLAIIASLVTAAITTPRWHFEQSKLDPNDQSNALTVLNIVFPAIFTIEFLIRVIAEGFSAHCELCA
ncbi:calcium channel protein [Entomortierella lignicola]|nr:calcium channel protein [Entomortierella lignicola]